MSYKVISDVDPQRVQDLLVGAFEGGSNYWLEDGRVELVKPAYSEMPEDGVVWYGNSKRNIFAEPDFKVTIETEDGAKTLDYAAIGVGLNLMAEKHPRHFSDMVGENDDATTSDVFLQLCLFKEVVYG